MLRAILSEKKISMYKLEKSSNLSHSTLSDLVNEKTKPENCSSSLLKDISKALNMSMDDLYDKLTYDDLSSIKCLLIVNFNLSLADKNQKIESNKIAIASLKAKNEAISLITPST